MSLGLTDEPVQLTHNYWGVLFSLVITGFPFAFLLILSYLSGIDPTLERAAATLGAGWAQRFRRITLPLLAPGPGDHVLPDLRAGLQRVPVRHPGRRPGGGTTRVISIAAYARRLRAVRLPDGVRDRGRHGRPSSWSSSPPSWAGARCSTPDPPEARDETA